MKNAQTAAWAQFLRRPDVFQARGFLTVEDDDGKRYHCCMGAGCTAAGIESQVGNVTGDWSAKAGVAATKVVEWGADRATGLAPAEFLIWLGFRDLNPEEDEWNLRPDWPEGMKFRPDTLGFRSVTFASLNDTERLTFDQIADVIDWCGVTYETSQ